MMNWNLLYSVASLIVAIALCYFIINEKRQAKVKNDVSAPTLSNEVQLWGAVVICFLSFIIFFFKGIGVL